MSESKTGFSRHGDSFGNMGKIEKRYMSAKRDNRYVEKAFEKEFGLKDSFVMSLNKKEAGEAKKRINQAKHFL